jgi:hypothetical protein
MNPASLSGMLLYKRASYIFWHIRIMIRHRSDASEFDRDCA